MIFGEIDLSEWDEVISRLMRGLTPSSIGLVAARTQEGRIRESYTERWEQGLSYTQNWGRDRGLGPGYVEWKLSVGAPDVAGVLTGSTLRALTSEADEEGGKVFLEGNWPNSEGGRIQSARIFSRMEHHRLGSEQGGGGGMFYDETGVDTPWGFIESEPFATKRFGTRRSVSGSPEIDFLYVGEGDEAAVGDAVRDLVDFMIDPGSGSPESLRGVFGI